MSKRTQQQLIELRRANIRKNNTRKGFKGGFSDKTGWDWLQLLGVLAIPLVVVAATIVFGWWQGQLADSQHQSDQKLAQQQQQAATLQTYIDNIQDLLLNHNLPKSKPTDDVAILARARTLTALQVLDTGRKVRLVQFLYEAQLIGFAEYDQNGILKLRHNPIIDLRGADLRGAILSPAIFSLANYSFATLSGVDLSDTDLSRAILSETNLSGANLSGANLSYANLSYAIYSHANLSDADLSDTDLSGANVSGADLSGVDLRFATLSETNLSGANLSGADLSGVDLRFAKNLTQQQLDQVFSCQYAILPPELTCHHNQ